MLVVHGFIFGRKTPICLRPRYVQFASKPPPVDLSLKTKVLNLPSVPATELRPTQAFWVRNLPDQRPEVRDWSLGIRKSLAPKPCALAPITCSGNLRQQRQQDELLANQ